MDPTQAPPAPPIPPAVQPAAHRAADIARAIQDRCAATPGIHRAVLLSAGGLVLCTDAAAPKDDAERLAALSSSLMSLTKAAAQAYDSGGLGAAVVTMQRHHLCMAPVDDRTGLVLLADSGTDTGQITYVAAVLAAEISALLDGETREHLGRFFLQPG
ncbi:roadblock/LC7 domain-containing protein [Streptomyces sp. NPDC051183]|uniref:roadblock/LC7 domain-containing protein n=1 Tax=unclassified Streptomyces TaxID=2593676 RepID=UPI003415763D